MHHGRTTATCVSLVSECNTKDAWFICPRISSTGFRASLNPETRSECGMTYRPVRYFSPSRSLQGLSEDAIPEQSDPRNTEGALGSGKSRVEIYRDPQTSNPQPYPNSKTGQTGMLCCRASLETPTFGSESFAIISPKPLSCHPKKQHPGAQKPVPPINPCVMKKTKKRLAERRRESSSSSKLQCCGSISSMSLIASRLTNGRQKGFKV